MQYTDKKYKEATEHQTYPNPLEQLQEVRVGYKWGYIDYRDAKYHGRILVTAFMPKKSHNKDNKPLIGSRECNNIDSNMVQYRDGPGVLILDNNIWIIATWHKNKLHSSEDDQSSNKVYIINCELNIIELNIKNKTYKNKSQQQEKWEQQFINYIEQVSYIGTIYTNHSITTPSNRYNKYIMMSQQQYTNKNRTWKWIIDLSQQSKSNTSSDPNVYFVQTEHPSPNISQSISIAYHNKIDPNQTKSHQASIHSIASYWYLINNLKQILLTYDKNQQQYNRYKSQQQQQFGFKIVENKQVTVNKINIINVNTNSGNINKDININKANRLETTILSNINNNECIYIKIATQGQFEDQDNKSSAFVIQQLGLLNKANTTGENRGGNQQLKEKYVYDKKYIYSIREIHSKSHSQYQIITPEISIEQYYQPNKNKKLKQKYRYNYQYNLYKKQNNNNYAYNYTPNYIYSNSQQYKHAQSHKKVLHLSSLNFVDKNHLKLTQSINQLFSMICTVYIQNKIAIIKEEKGQIANAENKMKGQKQYNSSQVNKQDIKRQLNKVLKSSKGTPKSKCTLHYNSNKITNSKYVQTILTKKGAYNSNKNEAMNNYLISYMKNIKTDSQNMQEKDQQYDQGQGQQESKQIDHELLSLSELTVRYEEINGELKKQAKKNHIPLAILNQTHHEQDQTRGQIRIDDEDKAQSKFRRKQIDQFQTIVDLRKSRFNSYNDCDVEYWQKEYSKKINEEDLKKSRRLSNINEGRPRINTHKSNYSIYTEYLQRYKR